MTKVRLKGKWRIVETKLWDKDFLDMMEPAYGVHRVQRKGRRRIRLRLCHGQPPLPANLLGLLLHLGGQ
jgi:hypothetical protein